jgi:outer membrane protein assembly factor BamB
MKWSLLIVLICLLCSSITEDARHWPMFQHDPQHSGYSPSRIPESLRQLWVNEQFGEPILRNLVTSGGILFASGYSSGYMIDIDTGAMIQQCSEIRAGFMVPAIENNKMYINAHSWVYCLDVDTEKMLWYHYVKYLDFLSYPIVVDGHVFIGGGQPIEDIPRNSESTELLDRARRYARRVMCLDAETGEVIWKFFADGRTEYSPAYFDGKIYVNTSQYVYCLGAETGELVWKNMMEWTGSSSLSLDAKRIFIRAREGLICLDIETGETLWTFRSESTLFRTPSVAYNKVFVSADDMLYCLSAETGEVIWELRTESHVTTPLVVADKRAAFGTASGNLYVVHAESGEVSDSCDLAYGTEDYVSEITTVVLSDGKLIAGQCGGKITCFEESAPQKSTNVYILSGIFLVLTVLSIIVWTLNWRKNR